MAKYLMKKYGKIFKNNCIILIINKIPFNAKWIFYCRRQYRMSKRKGHKEDIKKR